MEDLKYKVGDRVAVSGRTGVIARVDSAKYTNHPYYVDYDECIPEFEGSWWSADKLVALEDREEPSDSDDYAEAEAPSHFSQEDDLIKLQIEELLFNYWREHKDCSDFCKSSVDYGGRTTHLKFRDLIDGAK